MTGRIFIAADDLTGALDTGVQFAKAGLRVRVIPSPFFAAGDEDALVVCTQSRHLSPADAARIVRSAFAQARACGVFSVYFKKLDSTLRGNIGAELEGMAEALEAQNICLCNAFPAAGRTTANGDHYVNGIPLHETPFAKDPFNPIISSSIEEIICAQSPAAAAITRVCDAQTDAEIDALVESVPPVLAGCAGLAGALARKWRRNVPSESPSFSSPPLILLGSINPVADEQAAFAAAHGVPLLTYPEMPVQLPAIVQTPRPAGGVDIAAGAAMAQDMGRYFADWTAHASDVPVMVVGGDTLLACIEASRCESLIPLGEPMPGTVLLEARMQGRTCRLFSRAGGFGKPNAFVELIEWIHGGIKS